MFKPTCFQSCLAAGLSLLVTFCFSHQMFAQAPRIQADLLSLEDGLAGDVINTVIQDKLGYLWIGTNHGISRYDGYAFRNFLPEQNDSTTLQINTILFILEAENGNLWLGSDWGLHYFDRGQESFQNIAVDSSQKPVHFIFEDSQGDIWMLVGDKKNYLYRWQPKSGQLTQMLELETELAVEVGKMNILYTKRAPLWEDGEGRLWVGTRGKGLMKYQASNDQFESVAEQGDALSGDTIYSLLPEGDRLWIGSENGLSRYSIPASNPFVGNPGMIDEAFAIGFRNPHNLSFAMDSAGIAQLLVTEIGRDNIEEINVVEKGGSYGWGDREGPFVHNPESGTINGLDNLPANEVDNGYIFPSSFLGHDGIVGESFVGQAIAGSHVIQNGSVELDGQFVFVEFATDGRAYHVDFETMLQQVTKLDSANSEQDSPEDLTWVTPQELTILFDHDNDGSTPPLVRDSLKDVLDDEPDFVEIISAGKVRADLRLGEGPNGELFILNKRNGWVYLAVNTLAVPAEESEVIVELVDTTLIVMGTDGRDEIAVTQNGNTLTVMANGQTSTWPQAITNVEVMSGDGVDEVLIDIAQDVFVDGGRGADTLVSGVGNDVLLGGAGNDFVFGGPGHDQIFGNNGSDILSGGAGLDELRGGGGSDELNGGQDEDLLVGGTGFDQLFGGSGDDDLRGGQGQDILEGGQGNDRLRGNDGNDQLYGNADDDRLTGGDGIDFLSGGAGTDSATDIGEAGESGIEN